MLKANAASFQYRHRLVRFARTPIHSGAGAELRDKLNQVAGGGGKGSRRDILGGKMLARQRSIS